MIEWLADNVSVFKMQHNAHREFDMTVEQHLSHRARIGDAPAFLNGKDRNICVAQDTLWEMRLILPDGVTMDIAGSSLDNCISAGRHAVADSRILAA